MTATTRPPATRFAASVLGGSDFAGVAAPGGVTFRGATPREVSFRARSRQERTAVRRVVLDGARMDQLTYAGLGDLGADLSNVTVQ